MVPRSITGKLLVTALTPVVLILLAVNAHSETIDEALALAYSNNPTLNAQRAATRSVDESVALAKSGLRPQIEATAEYSSIHNTVNHRSFTLNPYGFGVTISQFLFDGFKTYNNVAAAQAAVYASREVLRNTEQDVLFDGASAYMNVIRDNAISNYRAQALEFLRELVRSENARFDVGESTRTDVAQAEAQQAAALAQLSAARASLQSSVAVYRQIIGKDPGNLRTPRGVNRLLPNLLQQSFDIAFVEHPAILATRYVVDQAEWNVKSAESDLLPRVTLQGSSSKNFNSSVTTSSSSSSSITARLTVPIYQGGSVSATVRQNKEVLGQRWIEVDQTVDSVRAAVVSAYSTLQAANSSAEANRAQLRAANLALQGSIEERRVGQRTTLDVLRAQQDVITAQVALANAERDIVVAGYALLSAIGRLSAERLDLAVVRYEPEEHYIAVKDKWFGLRTPDGR